MTKKRWMRCVMLAGLVGWAGCTEKRTPGPAIERAKVAHLISGEPTKPRHRLDFEFDGRLRLVGYDLDKATVRPGESFQVTWHWYVERTLPAGWLQFTHQADDSDRSRVNLDGNGPLRQSYPAHAWTAGEYVRDPQTVSVPEDWKSDAVKLYVGFWQGQQRLPISRGSHDGKQRVMALRMPVKARKKSAGDDVPKLTAARATGRLTMDGKLDEEDWQTAPKIERLVHTLTGLPARPETSVRLLFDEEHLYVAFEVDDRELRSPFRKHDDHLWEQDAVEIMVDPQGKGEGYFEVQVSPRGVVFDTRYDTRRRPQPFGHVDWSSRAKAGVSRRGKVDDDASDEGYTVEIALPWEAFREGSAAASPPAKGDVWRMNFYVMDARRESGKTRQRAVGWSPPRVNDFHVPERFGRVQFD